MVEHGQVNLCVLEGHIGAAWRIGDRKSCCIFSKEGECVRKWAVIKRSGERDRGEDWRLVLFCCFLRVIPDKETTRRL